MCLPERGRYFSVKMASLGRMAAMAAEAGGREEESTRNVAGEGLSGLAKRVAKFSVPGFVNNTRSLFIFSEQNFIRKYAKMIIEWGYPFLVYNYIHI